MFTSYVSGDGAQAQAQGYLKNAGQKDSEAEVIQGSYSYTAPDGKFSSFQYTDWSKNHNHKLQPPYKDNSIHILNIF